MYDAQSQNAGFPYFLTVFHHRAGDRKTPELCSGVLTAKINSFLP